MATHRVRRTQASAAVAAGGVGALAITAVQSLIVTPVVISTTGVAMYGAWAASAGILMWLQRMDLGIPNLMIQRIGSAYAQSRSALVAAYFTAGISALVVIALSLVVVGILVAQVIGFALGLDDENARVLAQTMSVASLSVGLMIVTHGLLGFSRAVQRTVFLSTMSVVSSVVGLVVAVTLAVGGAGLWAFAAAMTFRSGIMFVSALGFTLWFKMTQGARLVRINGRVVKEVLASTPATAIGGFAYAAAVGAEVALVGLIVGPESAAVYDVTSRLARYARATTDLIGFGAYGSFAHLVGSRDLERARSVWFSVTEFRTALVVGGVALILAFNGVFVTWWVGSNLYGGQLLTIALGFQILVGGFSFINGYLYRATGEVVRGSILLAYESGIAILLGAAVLTISGQLPSLPFASALVAAVFIPILMTKTAARLGGPMIRGIGWSVWRVVGTWVLLLVAGSVVGSVIPLGFGLEGLLIGAAGGCLIVSGSVWATDPVFRSTLARSLGALIPASRGA